MTRSILDPAEYVSEREITFLSRFLDYLISASPCTQLVNSAFHAQFVLWHQVGSEEKFRTFQINSTEIRLALFPAQPILDHFRIRADLFDRVREETYLFLSMYT